MPLLDPSRLDGPATNDAVLDAFLGYLIDSGIEPYDHQETAILELYGDRNVILNTPTGSGKTLVALAVQFRAVCQGRRSFYTVPVKALANEKFLALCETFGPEKVGMITGDATVNPSAPVICCTAEILANHALREGAGAAIDDVIMDEFHYYSDNERGVAWQIPLLTLPRARFLLMSATLGDTSFFERELTRLTGAETVLVKSAQRPVPLEFDYNDKLPLEEMVEELVKQDRAPIYLVHFTQLSCAESAQNLMSRNYCSREEKEAIAAALVGADFRSPYGKEIQKLIRHGIGIHHAGLLPKYRVLVEKLAQRGLLKVICGTDTLGVGVNVPIRTVHFTQLFKYSGDKTKILASRDFHQIAGRAGRRGFDTLGYVVAQAPAHVIANLRAEAKAGEKGGKNRLVKQKSPEGFVMWEEKTYRNLVEAEPERLVSRFSMHHGLLLNILSRRGEDGCLALRRLIRDCHESEPSKKKLRRRAFALFRGLIEGKILTFIPKAERSGPEKVALHIELQEDFSLNQVLGLYLLEAIGKLEFDSPDYALNVLSLIESILEDPGIILRRQVEKAKTALVAEMKAEGLDYDERMERLEEVTHPQPGKDFIYSTYNEFVLRNPWAKEAGVRPKSIAREMFENWQSFEDYVKHYKIERSEAVLLRHLSEVYKVLVQTVPPGLKTMELDEAETFFGTMLHGIDSTLLDEWERMKDDRGVASSGIEETAVARPRSIIRDQAAFTRLVRGTVFDFLKKLWQGDEAGALALASKGEGMELSPGEQMGAFREARGQLRFDPEARNAKHFHLTSGDGSGTWRVEQILVDGEGLNDWSARFLVSLSESEAAGNPVLSCEGISPLMDPS
ncbi:MAG: DUF3516 domain-containing protein [Verrucomicrobiae bacterium]|nr:DUF3516 domain-containing protein [Verrucomicrobiae bacterium]